MTNLELIQSFDITAVDVLANDLNQHCADLAENFCGGQNCLTCLAHALTEKGYRKASEVAKEIFAELELKAPFFCENQIAHDHFNEELAELKKKYTEEGK